LSRIDSVCEEHPISIFWEIIHSYGLSENFKPTDDCSYALNDENFVISILGEMKE